MDRVNCHDETWRPPCFYGFTVGVAVLRLALFEVEEGLCNVLRHVLKLAQCQLHGLELLRLGQLRACRRYVRQGQKTKKG